jgi:Protein of unknown function (DUF3105)
MASRKEQKEQARQQRLAEERARLERERRQRRLQVGIGSVLAVLVVVAVGVAIAASGGSKTGSGNPVKTPAKGNVKLPPAKETNLTTAAKQAGCVTIDTPDAIARTDQNRTHVDPKTKVPYATNPPSYGPHYPSPASDGEYKPSDTPKAGYLVHALEHGRIEYEYSPSLPAAEVQQLNALFNEGDGQWAPRQMLLLFQNQTGMKYAVAATAWGHILGCAKFTPAVFDALRDFRLAYTNLGPEQLGTGPE